MDILQNNNSETSKANGNKEGLGFNIEHLVNESRKALKNSYSPYSRFPVGAALLCQDGSIYRGCNVETATLNAGICAERTALVKAVSDGHRKFLAISIASNMKDEFISPCGVCRQFMVEFGTDLAVVLTKPDGAYQLTDLNTLLPQAFTPESLTKNRIE